MVKGIREGKGEHVAKDFGDLCFCLHKHQLILFQLSILCLQIFSDAIFQ